MSRSRENAPGHRPQGLLALGVAALLLLTQAGCLKRGVTPIRTHFNKGVYHYSKGGYDAAISEYRLALEEDPGDYRARFNLAEALEAKATRLERGEAPQAAENLRQEAEEHYERLLSEDPGDLRATVNLAARDFQRGDRAAAEKRLRAAIERHPRAALPRVALAAQRLRPDADPGSVREAVALLEEVLQRDPAHLDANMLLGRAYEILEQTDGAREAYRRALEKDSSDLATLMALARLERRAGRFEEAERFLRRALYVNPELLEAHVTLSEVLASAGDLEGATLHLWRGRQLEDERWRRLSSEDYQRRLLDLYRRLAERERTPAHP